MSKKSFVPGTDIPYENWIQAWIVTLRANRRNQSKPELKNKILYIDMDNVLADFTGAFENLEEGLQKKYYNKKDEVTYHVIYIDDLPEILEMLPDNIQKILFTPHKIGSIPEEWHQLEEWSSLPKLLFS